VPSRALVPALFLLAAACTPANAQSPCDDVSYAREFRSKYPGELNKVFEREFMEQAAWSARAKAIADHVVAAGAATREQQNASTLEIMKSPVIRTLDEQARKAGDDFRLRNDTLVATPPLAILDPMRPNRAWCMLASQALQSLQDKLAAESASWAAQDRLLLAAAAARGVRFAP
jgi:hypothetical protein